MVGGAKRRGGNRKRYKSEKGINRKYKQNVYQLLKAVESKS